MYVCMYEYAGMYARTYVSMYEYVCMYVCTSMYVCMYARVYVYVRKDAVSSHMTPNSWTVHGPRVSSYTTLF